MASSLPAHPPDAAQAKLSGTPARFFLLLHVGEVGKPLQVSAQRLGAQAALEFGPASENPRPDETLIRALARAHRWKRLIEDGTIGSAAEIAEADGVTRSFVNRLLRLTLLAPDIVGECRGQAAERDAAGGVDAVVA